MGRLIKLEELKKIYQSRIDFLLKANQPSLAGAVKGCMDIAEFTVPAVDAVPVIRCKDCKFYSHVLTGINEFGTCKYCIYPTPDDFCNHGERAGGEQKKAPLEEDDLNFIPGLVTE